MHYFFLHVLHFTFYLKLIIRLKAKKEEASMCKFEAIRNRCVKAQISQKMHKKLYMMVIKLLLRFLRHKMIKLKPNKKKKKNMRSAVENLKSFGRLLQNYKWKGMHLRFLRWNISMFHQIHFIRFYNIKTHTYLKLSRIWIFQLIKYPIAFHFLVICNNQHISYFFSSLYP